MYPIVEKEFVKVFMMDRTSLAASCITGVDEEGIVLLPCVLMVL